MVKDMPDECLSERVQVEETEAKGVNEGEREHNRYIFPLGSTLHCLRRYATQSEQFRELLVVF